VAHGFSRWEWSRARFPIAGEQYRAEIDALAVRKGNGKFARIDRVSVSRTTECEQSRQRCATPCVRRCPRIC
jgi:hypothetical protein